MGYTEPSRELMTVQTLIDQWPNWDRKQRAEYWYTVFGPGPDPIGAPDRPISMIDTRRLDQLLEDAERLLRENQDLRQQVETFESLQSSHYAIYDGMRTTIRALKAYQAEMEDTVLGEAIRREVQPSTAILLRTTMSDAPQVTDRPTFNSFQAMQNDLSGQEPRNPMEEYGNMAEIAEETAVEGVDDCWDCGGLMSSHEPGFGCHVGSSTKDMAIKMDVEK